MLDFPRWKAPVDLGVARPRRAPRHSQPDARAAPPTSLGLARAAAHQSRPRSVGRQPSAARSRHRRSGAPEPRQDGGARSAPRCGATIRRSTIGDISTTANGSLSLLRPRRRPSSMPRSSARARRRQAIGVTGQRDWNVGGDRFDPNRHDPHRRRPRRFAADQARCRPRPRWCASASTSSARASRRSSARAASASSSRCRACRIRPGLKALLGKTAKLEFKLVDLVRRIPL